ncbi:SDR family NAD(P)-dependent oxidoreductase [Spirosoma oryzicola]|uniref:SDR family NAD(P)-dependent oxidoreductase n=1 Tax=Spirosoma oryzicola TaxID=2898794 RepID=UPI001E525167|nr:SDR family oxidoreductase [Spirosoma oryzicola]UHG92963.1 SDR family oxidoreductase [Spirosoma oryzicola]
METQPNGKTALITGASSGIGRELTRLFAKDGYKLVLIGRDEESLQQQTYNLKNQYGTQATIIRKDLADPKAPEEIYAETSQQGLTIDVLVNDAGFGHYGLFATETDLQKELDVVQVNAVALMHLTKLYLKDMVARNEGKILMLGSEVSVVPNPMMAVYGATKAFIKSFSEAIRNELKDTNVTVTVLMPGATNTDFFNKAGAAHVKGADPQKTANPSDVAKEGYEALMQGKDHVVAGWANKARVALGHVLPDPLLAAQTRKDMTPKEEAEQAQKKSIGLALVVGAAVLGGLWLLSQNKSAVRSVEAYGKGLPKKARFKAKMAGRSAQDALASVGDSVKGAYHHAKATVEEAVV